MVYTWTMDMHCPCTDYNVSTKSKSKCSSKCDFIAIYKTKDDIIFCRFLNWVVYLIQLSKTTKTVKLCKVRQGV